MRAVLWLVLGTMGCATVPPPPTPIFIAESRRPEERELPLNPRTEQLPSGFSGEEWVEPLEQGAVALKAGLLISESRAARDILVRTRYDEMRSLYSADQDVWRVQRKYYEERLQFADQAILGLQPTWWDLNKDAFFFWGGVVLGTGLTLGVTSVAVGVTR